MLMMLTLGLLEIEEVRRVVRERKSSWGSFCLLLMISLNQKLVLWVYQRLFTMSMEITMMIMII